MARCAPLSLFLVFVALCSLSTLLASASSFLPLPTQPSDSFSYYRRTDQPQFPSDITSCPICARNYGSINSCAAAAPVLQNFTMIIFNPGAFIDVIKCACVDTFQSTYPQCVDCFIRTNQTQLLDADSSDLPSIVRGMRQVCAIESTLLGNVSVTDGEANTTTTSTSSAAVATTSNGAAAPVVMLRSALFVTTLLSVVAALP